MDNVKTLLVGIQDLKAVPYGATLRVKQHANELAKATYYNVGNKQWNSRSFFSKALQAIRFLRPWTEPFVGYHYSNLQANRLIRHLQQNRYERIVLTEIWTFKYLRIVREYGGKAKIVFDFHNVESNLQKQLANNLYEKWRLWLIANMETRIVNRTHEIWVCSEQDASLFKDLYGVGLNVKVVPNRFEVNGQFIKQLSTDKSIGYVGCFNYAPNEEAALELLYRIRPAVQASLRLVGKNPTDRLKAWNNGEVIVTGEVASVSDELRRIRTIVLPIRSGSGTRLKVLEAFAHGIPVVATAKAVEGLNVKSGEHYLQAETQEEFRVAIETLWGNKQMEEEIRQKARKLVEEHYAWNQT